ncbi:MAG TPA: helix-turn-helix transcriptional regulator [Thermoanaerobaculia bacterium]|nr:helix-turn-helix transcriptional regulator [Thermoanaerobaculia bacterium]
MTAICAGGDCHAEHLQKSTSLARLRGLHVAGLHVLEVAFHAGARLASHAHAHARFSFVLAGAIGESFAGRTLRCERNAFSFHPAALPHANEMSAEGARALLIEVCANPGPELAALVGDLPDPFAVSQRRMRDVAVDLSRVLRSDDVVQSILAESLALDLLARGMRLLEQQTRGRQPKAPAWLDDFVQLVDDRLDTHLSLTDAASLLRVTPRQLATALRRYRATTFVELIRNRRLERARGLLRDTDIPLAEVALASGFADQSHLTRRFRFAFGVTPARFRRKSDTR